MFVLQHDISHILCLIFRYTAKSLQSCLTLCDPIDGSPPGSPRPWDSPGKNTGVGCHILANVKINRNQTLATLLPKNPLLLLLCAIFISFGGFNYWLEASDCLDIVVPKAVKDRLSK